MGKIDIKTIAQKAIIIAGEGVTLAGDITKKFVSDINDGIEAARENKNKNELANKILDGVYLCVKELEEENKVKTPGNTHDELKRLIDELNNMVQAVKQNPYECKDTLAKFVEKYRVRMSEIPNYDSSNDILEQQIMQKHYETAFNACMTSLRIVEAEEIQPR